MKLFFEENGLTFTTSQWLAAFLEVSHEEVINKIPPASDDWFTNSPSKFRAENFQHSLTESQYTITRDGALFIVLGFGDSAELTELKIEFLSELERFEGLLKRKAELENPIESGLTVGQLRARIDGDDWLGYAPDEAVQDPDDEKDSEDGQCDYEYGKTYTVTEIASEYNMPASFLNNYLAKKGVYDKRSLYANSKYKILKPRFVADGYGDVIQHTDYSFSVFTESGREYIKDMINADLASGKIVKRVKSKDIF